jgi:DNA repair protein RadD
MPGVPRDYQDILFGQSRDGFRSGAKRQVIVAPTGSGKGFMIAYMASGAEAKGSRIYIIVHRGELVDQLSASLRAMDVRHGRIQPGWPESRWPIQVAMIQTLSRRLQKYEAPDFIICDESHHIIASTYQKVIDYWPNAKVVGYTATPLRLDGRGLGRAFDSMVVGPGVRQLIDAGWLADFDYYAPPTPIDMSSVSIKAGDYSIDELAAASDKPRLIGDLVAHYRTYLDRRPAIAFAVRVDHAEHIAQQAREAGIAAVAVDGKTSADERKARISGLGNGNTELLCSCELVGEGLDIPAVSGALLARRTKSLAMYLQWCGRVLRPKPDGSRAVILDHAGNVLEGHGMPDAIRTWTLDDKKRRAPADPAHTCDRCYRVFAGGPNWRDGQECDYPDDPACALLPPEETKAEWKPPEVEPGELQRFTNVPAWGGGVDILHARGGEWRDLLDRADTRAKLEEIRRARGYSAAWVGHVLRARANSADKRRFG